MNPNRAAFLVLVDKYQVQTRQSGISLPELHSLAYLMQAAEQPLRLEFEKGSHGPFASNLDVVLSSMLREHVLDGYDGAKGKIKLEPTAVTRAQEIVSSDNESGRRIESVSSIFDNCIGPLGLQSLAIVVWLTRANNQMSRECAIAEAREWNRKALQFDRYHIMAAYDKLVSRGWIKRNNGKPPTKVQAFSPPSARTLAAASRKNPSVSGQTTRTPVSSLFRPEQRELLGFVLFYDPKKNYGKVQLKDSTTLKFNQEAFCGVIRTDSFVVMSQPRGNFASNVRPTSDLRLLLSGILDSEADRDWRIRCLNHVLGVTTHEAFRALLLVHAELEGLVKAEVAVQFVAAHYLRQGAESRSILEAPLKEMCTRVPETRRGALLPEKLWEQPAFWRLLPSNDRFRFEVGYLDPIAAASAYFDLPEGMRPEVQRYLPADVMAIPEVFETLAPPYKRQAVRNAPLSQLGPLRDRMDGTSLGIYEKRLRKVRDGRALHAYRRSRPTPAHDECPPLPGDDLPTPLALSGNWDRGWAIGHYGELVDLVRGFKYHNDKELVSRLVLFAQVLCRREFYRADCIIPIPPTQQAREYQPVLTFVEGLSSAIRISVLHALRKTRRTERQKEQDDLPAKTANLRGAFEVIESVDGKRVLLVDDIFDSGLTMLEATHMLRMAKAREVGILAIAALRPSQLSPAEFLNLRLGGSTPKRLVDAIQEFLPR